MDQTAILLLTANPDGTAYLRIDREIKQIEQGLLLTQQRDRFVFKASQAVTVPDLRRAMQQHRPQIVHFSGHGEGTAGLCFEDAQGKIQLVHAEALSGFFSLFAAQVRCVVLNACYSEMQAQAIVQHIDYVIGMSDSITDQAAIVFSVAFYESLGNGESIESAYKFACAEIALFGLKEEHIPKLIRRQQAPVPTAATYEEFSSRTVFLAECSDDLAEERDQVKICLQQQNVQVLPEDLYYFPKDDQVLQQAVRHDLARSELYIQLLSNVQPKRPPGMSTPLLQHQLAAEAALPRLQWRHPDTVLEPRFQEQFGTEQISCGLEEFKQHLIKQLHKIGNQRQERTAAGQNECGFVFIDAAPEDMHLTRQLIQCLQEYDFCDVAVPLQDAQNALAAMRDLEENFKEADMVLLLYHAASQAWIRQHLRQCRKAQSGRKNSLIAVCQDQPEGKKEIGMILPNLKIFNCADFTAESCLPTLLRQLKGRN